MKKQIVSISILQSSKIVVALYFLFGFLYTLIGIPMMIFGGKEMKIIGAVYTVMPFFMAIIGFIFFAIAGLVYNGLARFLGGFEMEVVNVDEPMNPPYIPEA